MQSLNKHTHYNSGANTDDNSGRFDMEEGLDDFMTMYAAGNATTSTTLLWCLGQLTRNPGVMDKLVDEVFVNNLSTLYHLYNYDNEHVTPCGVAFRKQFTKLFQNDISL